MACSRVLSAWSQARIMVRSQPCDCERRAMKILLPMLLATTLVLASCASTPSTSDDQKLALYRAHAGAPVPSFHYLGRFHSWTDIGDRAVAIWTRPGEAWLLELS